MDGVQPERGPLDGMVHVFLDDNGLVNIECTHAGNVTTCYASEFNAYRLAGLLCLILGIKLSKAVGKSIKLGNEMKVKYQ